MLTPERETHLRAMATPKMRDIFDALDYERSQIDRLTKLRGKDAAEIDRLRAEVERLTESVVTTGNLNLQLAREVERLDGEVDFYANEPGGMGHEIALLRADAERLAEAGGWLAAHCKGWEIMPQGCPVGMPFALTQGREALRQHEERVKP